MIELKVRDLQKGDEFTMNDGETWVKVHAITQSEANSNQFHVVGMDSNEVIFARSLEAAFLVIVR